jgi:peptide/nickel transport system substrate-binding protein
MGVLGTGRPTRAVLLVVALLLTACGSGGGDPAGDAPAAGGTLTYGLPYDVPGLNPVTDAFGGPGHAMARTMLEPLTALDESGDWQPYLAEAVTPDEDASEWTIAVRAGVTFSNGEPLDGDVVAANLQAQVASPLHGAIMAPVRSVVPADERTVVVTLDRPWSTFPYYLSTQIGLMVPPASLADPVAASSRPVGTGPFVLADHVRDSTLTVTRNPTYWRAAEGLPLLDEIEFRFLPDPETARQTLESGGVDAIPIADSRSIQRFGEMSGFAVTRVAGTAVPVQAYALNTVTAPTDDVRVRRAMALATDRQALVDTLFAGLAEPADGPWTADAEWLVDTGYPDYDRAAAAALVDEYERENGPVEITLVGLADPTESIGLVVDMWEQAGISVNLETVDEATYVDRLLTGRFNAMGYSPETPLFEDPDAVYLTFQSRFAAPVGEIALNPTRIADAELDAALDQGRASTDPAERRAAYGRVQQRLTDLLPFVWVAHTTSAVITEDDVHGIGEGVLPTGQRECGPRGMPTPAHSFAAVWVER